MRKILFVLVLCLGVSGCMNKSGNSKKINQQTPKENIKKVEEFIYETNLNISLEEKNLDSASQFLIDYKKDYPDSLEKQGEYERRIEQLKKEIVDNYNSALNRTYIEEDEVQGTKFRLSNIQSKTAAKSLIVPYLGYNGAVPYIRFRIVFYSPNGWLFFQKAVFRIDDSLVEYEFNYNDINRQVIYASEIIETLDIDPSADQLDVLRKIAKSQKTILRLVGQNHVEDRTIGDKEKQAINDILTIYDYENNPM